MPALARDHKSGLTPGAAPDSKRKYKMAKWLKISSAAEHMDASVSTVRRLIAAGTLKLHRLSNGMERLDREEIDRLFASVHNDAHGSNIVTPDEERLFVRRKRA